MRELNVEAVLERMKNIVQVKTDKDLAGYLFAKTTTFSNWKKNNSIPLETLISFVDKHNLSMDWLMFGKENSAPQLGVAEQMMLTAFSNLDDKQKLEAIGLLSGLGKSAVGGKNIFNDNTNIGVMTDSITKPITQHFGKRKK
ncbi:helix-turn-helix domain-containing protein [Pasteurella testudinis]|nr:helix-turn-helix domain-containing protein [Pasteurella testudinis]